MEDLSEDEDDNPSIDANQDTGQGINFFFWTLYVELILLCRDDIPLVHLDASVLSDHPVEEEEYDDDDELDPVDEMLQMMLLKEIMKQAWWRKRGAKVWWWWWTRFGRDRCYECYRRRF